jgi:hypothetical protein
MKLKELFCSTKKKEVKKVILIGGPSEIETFAKAIKKDVLIEPIYTYKEPTTTDLIKKEEELPKEEIYPKLEKKLSKSDEKTLIIMSDRGGSREYKVEEIAIDSKRISNATFVLLTSNPECIQSLFSFNKFVRERGFDPFLVSKSIDYIFHYKDYYREKYMYRDNEEIFNLIISNHESRLNYMYDKNRLILVFEERPFYYTAYLKNLYKEKQDYPVHFLLAREYGEAKEFALNGKNRFVGAIFSSKYILETDILEILTAYNGELPVIVDYLGKEELSKVMKINKNVYPLSTEDKEFYSTPYIGRMINIFGFGDFRVEMKWVVVIKEAKNLEELYELIKTIDGETLLYRASRNEFSNWLYLHGFSEVADAIKAEVPDASRFISEEELLRKSLLSVLEPFVKKSQKK